MNPIPPATHQFERVRNSLMRKEDGRWTYRYDKALRDPSRRRNVSNREERGWQAVDRINSPTLLIRGEHSALLDRETAHEFIHRVGNGRLIEIAGSGHPVPLDKPVEFLAAVETFL